MKLAVCADGGWRKNYDKMTAQSKLFPKKLKMHPIKNIANGRTLACVFCVMYAGYMMAWAVFGL